MRFLIIIFLFDISVFELVNLILVAAHEQKLSPRISIEYTLQRNHNPWLQVYHST